MPLPVWIVGIRDPAYAYMLRSSGVRRPRTRLRRPRAGPVSLGYAPVGSGRARQPTTEETQDLRTQAAEAQRSFMTRFHDIERRHGELLRATAAELTRAGATTLRTTAGDIRARIIRFRKEAVVLEIHYPGGRSQAGLTQSTVGEASVHQLASALASARPDAEPLSG
jgi:hypothetical protein